MSSRKKHQCHSCQSPMKGHKRGPDGTFICPTSFPLPSTSRVAPTPFPPRQGTVPRLMSPPIPRGLTIELDEKGDQVFVNGQRYSRIMPGTLDSQVWTWIQGGNTSRQATPGILEIEDDDDVEIIEDDDDEVEYLGEIPRLTTRPPSLQPRMFSLPHRTPAPSTHRHSTARDLGKRRQMEPSREMSIASAAGDDWPLASLYGVPSDRVQQVVQEAKNHGLYARVIPRSRVVPAPVENTLPWIKEEEEYVEEDSGFFENFGEGSSGRMLNGNTKSGRAGKERERDGVWEVVLGTDEGAVEHLQRIVLSNQEDERQRESRRASGHRQPPAVNINPPPAALPAPIAVTPAHPGTSWSSIMVAMLMGAMAMFYALLKMPDD